MDFLPTLAELGIKILPGKIYNLCSVIWIIVNIFIDNAPTCIDNARTCIDSFLKIMCR